MNSAISSQPAVVGPNTASTMGLAIRKRTITCLYQTGALPRKLRVKPETSVSDIAFFLLEEGVTEVSGEALNTSLKCVFRLPAHNKGNDEYIDLSAPPKLALDHVVRKKVQKRYDIDAVALRPAP